MNAKFGVPRWQNCCFASAVLTGKTCSIRGHLCKHPSRCLHAPESLCALAMSPAHLDYSCTVVTSLSYPEILTSGKVIFLYIFYSQMVADNTFGTKLLYLDLRGVEQVFELSTLGARRKSASTGYNFLIFIFAMRLSSNAWWISLLCFTVCGFEMENVGKPEVVLPKQSAKNIIPVKRHA